jgi:L-ribulose-5-phosphate 3-epimerase
MEKVNRREFLGASVAVGVASSLGVVPAKGAAAPAGPKRPAKDGISLAQWALVQEIRDGKWKNSDFPRIAREDFDINGIEFVNTLFELPTLSHLNQLQRNAEKYKVTMVLIMVDDEGETCDPSKETRIQTAINHRKWVDIAKYLGCHSIRTNCRGPRNAPKDQALEWAADTYKRLLDYAVPAGIGVVIENHGGLSNDPDWMIRLIKKINNPFFGSYPDWREPGPAFDNVGYLKKMIPYAFGTSYRNQPTEKQTAALIKLCHDSGYKGWYGIESSGRDAIKLGKKMLDKYLLKKG